MFENEGEELWGALPILAVSETIASPLKGLLGQPGPLHQMLGEQGVQLFIALRALAGTAKATRTLGLERQMIAEGIVFTLLNGTTSKAELLAIAHSDRVPSGAGAAGKVSPAVGELVAQSDQMASFESAFDEALTVLSDAGVVVLHPDGDLCQVELV